MDGDFLLDRLGKRKMVETDKQRINKIKSYLGMASEVAFHRVYTYNK